MQNAKTADDWKREWEQRQARNTKQLEKAAKSFPVPDGFMTEWRDDLYRTDRIFVMTRGKGDIEFIFRPGGSGTTNFKTDKGVGTYDRPGVDDSFHWIKYSYTKGVKDKVCSPDEIKATLDEQFVRIEKSRAFAATALTIPDIGFSVSPEALEDHKKTLKTRGHISFMPSGFGTGYNITRRTTRRYGVKKGSAALEAFFGIAPLYVESFDCD